ncbi:phenylalanine--tRNA ligase subunit beta [candidate division WOR-1 bacterium RIFOXYA12_FULL_43_27]|uniref:Phenylalanine--tRNA ligase beta subunit n=1 Tax=candidate division WOR-1 bacterium RIFOXYC2_FULL_46_14 TaxID=1802587 RepID=A0A1F4U3P2_UNCSA|nr:MAG: phenylalanine--tRNA ligase subunit beta [candidate division WOR-1 bacterium RIFOXYA12_FULL_43_27]OGC20107.1 MAG: phenylalanine--tRNA ligase subunit beta [candidate division WOR-1 bacterium RIFOXYB2_FULL_46_45]OGC32156.1 MAG: phenylalanine--tRNA ligase subunit beta [candidate division WOR-1 bacterium RIFOXYA2_FULL_46_56]OGC39556.1 MAG: phenylalanine--tRNA ligase subunit beta [candidate division WOR-1 bacterium RIFOXYC2_FULL_46_14]
MKIPISWLKEYVDIKISPEELAERLTMAGTETTARGELLELDILPNRGDLQSVIGIAREIVTILDSKLHGTKYKVLSTKEKTNVPIEVKERKLCPRYMARVIKGVKIKDSPDWMKERLVACGLRPINNIVDITNYILLEYGQPLHAFDFDKVNKIVVRKAAEGETIQTLDGTEHKLDPSILVIADSTRPIAVAGIMGGKESEVSERTQNILLESAFFDPVSTNKSSQFLKLRTESSIRFGKGVDWEGVEMALHAAAALITELAEGTICDFKADKKSFEREPKIIKVRTEAVNRILGTELSKKEIDAILKRLNFLNGIPLYRAGDIEREIDVIEEIARIYGYHKIKAKLPQEIEDNPLDRLCVKTREIMAGAGLFEVQTFSILDPQYPDRLKLRDAHLRDFIKVANPLTEEESVLRTIVLPSLLKVVDHNRRHQVDDVKIFEIGKVYYKGEPHIERMMLAGALTKTDFFFTKAAVSALLNEFGSFEFKEIKTNLLNLGKSAGIVFEGEGIGWLGELAIPIARNYDFTEPVFVFELDLELLLKNAAATKKHAPLPRFPKTDRDVAFFVKEGVTHSSILAIIRQTGGNLVEEIQLFDIYNNSRAYRITYRDPSRTLKVEEVNELHTKICDALVQKLGVELRK